MAVPANRVPVRVARGLKSALTANLADLYEGEVLYAKDEDQLYVVEGGVLVAMGADLSTSSIDALSDVDTTTLAPTDGQVLTWDNTAGQWEPADAAGGVTDGDKGDITVTASGATWTIDTDAVTTDKIASLAVTTAKMDLSGVVAGTYTRAAITVNNRGRVTGATAVPEPTVMELGDTAFVQTGGVRLGFWDTNQTNNVPAAQGEWSNPSYNELRIYTPDAEATDVLAAFNALPASGSIWVSPDGGDFVEWTYLSKGVSGSMLRFIDTNIDTWNSVYTTIEIYSTQPTFAPLADGDVIQYSTANSAWQPSGGSGLRSALGIGEYADDAAAGTGGVASGALYYNTTSSDYRLKA